MEESSRRECARDAIAPKPRRPNGPPATASAGEGIDSPPTDLRLKGHPLLRFGRWCPSYSLLKCGPLPEAAFEEPRRKGRYWLRRSGAPRRPDSVCTPSCVARQLAASVPRKTERRADAQRASRGRSGKPRLYAGRSVHVLVHRLALVLLELREHEVV